MSSALTTWKDHQCWATPILVKIAQPSACIQAGLSEIVYSNIWLQSCEPLSNVGSRRTASDLFKSDCIGITWLKELVYDALREVHLSPELAHARSHWPGEIVAEAWGNVYEHGDYQQPHVHHGSAWSCVYFVEAAGDLRAGGTLELYPPHVGCRQQLATSIFGVVPISGMLVIFPSWVSHSVSPIRGAQPRVSIAVNINFA